MCTLHKNKKDFRKVKKWMYELIISLSIAVIALLIYKQQATSKKYSKLKRSIKTSKELKAREKERKKEQARNKKLIDRAYKAASQFTSNRKSELFRQVFNEYLKTYREEEEEKQKLYQSASDD